MGKAAVQGDATRVATFARLAAVCVASFAVKGGGAGIGAVRWQDQDHAGRQGPGHPRYHGRAGDRINASDLSARLPRQTPRMAVIAGQRFSACVIRHFGAGLPKAFVPPLA